MREKLLRLIELVLQVDWKHDYIATIHVCSSKGISLQLLKLGITNQDRIFERLESDEVEIDNAIWAVDAVLNGIYVGGRISNENNWPSLVGAVER
jgi:hypothetical protein